MGIRSHKVLLDSTSAVTGDWFRLDSRHEVDSIRALQVDLTTGDIIEIQATTVDVRGGNPADVVTNLQADDITTIESLTSSGNCALAGPWTYIRAVKTGTTGSAKVQGYI